MNRGGRKPARMNREHGYVWPSADQQQLLDAGLLQGQRAMDAFEAWRASVRLEDDFSPATVRLLPLVYQNLHALGVQDPLLQRLKGVYRHSWYATHRLLYTTAPVIAALTAAGIPVMLIKGVPLAMGYYPNPAARPMSDIDVVIPPPVLNDALGVLARLGWRGPWPDPDLIHFRHAVQRFGPSGGELDLHWKPLYETLPGARSGDSFFATSEPIDFKGSIVRQPDPTHALFMTVVHGVRWNLETPVRWIPDALMILRRRGTDIDWDLFQRLVREYRVVRRATLGLEYLVDRFQPSIPPALLAGLRAMRPTMFERFESRVLLSDDGTLHPSVMRTQMSWVAEYGRHSAAQNPLSMILGFTHYMRFRLGLSGRRELLPRIAQGLLRRVVPSNGPATGHPGSAR